MRRKEPRQEFAEWLKGVRPEVCPKCRKKDKVVPVLVGLAGPEACKAERAGKVRLYGCIVHKVLPEWYCKRCRRFS